MAEQAQPDRRSWTVTLVCGASGVGKSSIAIQLAARYGVPLAEADDIVTALRALTTPQQSPVLHYWDTHPEVRSWAPERIAELHFAVADALRPGVEAVIADHIEYGAPVVFEGDYLVPELAAGFGGAARAVVLGEPDDERVVANFRAREPNGGDQRDRARVSTLIDAQLTKRARAVGMPVVPARPWHDGLDRVDRALRAWRRPA
jgi:2-phosphoglycerate kinase